MAKQLLGAPVAEALDENTHAEVERLTAQGVTPTLAIVRVGEKPDQISYEKGATKRCEKVGVAVRNERLAADASQDEVMGCIARLNADRSVHGILLLAPLPAHLDSDTIRNLIAIEKDVDVANDVSLNGVFINDPRAFAPCTPQACIEMLDYYQIPIEGKRVCVLGRSLVVGKPVSMLLLDRNATVTICHSRTQDMPAVAREADILVVAIGRERMIGAEYVRPGQTVIDVGINYNDTEQRLYGDADYDAIESIVDAITPVPKGVGSVTTSVLVSHVVESARKASVHR